MLATWPLTLGGARGVTIDELLDASTAYGSGPQVHQHLCPGLREAIEKVAAADKYSLQIPKDVLGRWLRDHKDRIVSARKLIRTGNPKKSARWKVVKVPP